MKVGVVTPKPIHKRIPIMNFHVLDQLTNRILPLNNWLEVKLYFYIATWYSLSSWRT